MKWRNRHHIVPRSRGGSSDHWNLLLIDGKVHQELHRVFGLRTLEEIIRLLQRVQRAKNAQFSPVQILKEEKRMSFHYKCNHCLKKIGSWNTLDYDNMVIFPGLGLRFHRHCWHRMHRKEKTAIIRREGRT